MYIKNELILEYPKYDNINEFLANDIKDKEEIEDYYENYLLPFWDEEVERVVVEGKRKDFNIYLISNS